MAALFAATAASPAPPAGTPILADLLRRYPVRPPWKVAGVDYAVGVPAGTALADPATLALQGVSVDAGRHTVTVTGSNVTLSGCDFGRSGGWSVLIAPGAANTTVENSRFQVGANDLVPLQASVGAGSLTLHGNTMDGGGGRSEVVYALVAYNGTGTFTAQYNSFLNAPADAIDFSAGRMTTIVRYNVFANLGTSPGSHPDSVQYVGVQSSSAVIAFNTVYQPHPGGMEGIQLAAQNGSKLTHTSISNNVLVAHGAALAMSYSIAIQQAPGNMIDGVSVADNYIDASAAYGPFYPPTGANLAFTGNINLATGERLAPPKGAGGP